MIAQTNKLKVGSKGIAKAWLKEQGYVQVKGIWLKGQLHAARIEQLVTGRVAIIEGVTA